MDFQEHKAFYSGYTCHRSFFTYHRCTQCRGLFCRTYFTDEQLTQLYAHQAENTAEAPLACRERTQQGYFQILRKHCSLTGQMLELGPDIGLFTRCCAREGKFEKFWLYEPNVEVFETLRKNLGAANYFLTERPYSAAGLPDGSLSAAVLIHVLDHILSLESLLADLRRSLKPGGVLFVVTHNEASMLAGLLGRRWPPFTLQHPQLFSPESMRKLLGRHGFEVEEIVGCANYFPVAYLAKSVLAILGLTASSQTSLVHPSIGIKLGNMATIARKKP